jgi:GT2 family glycosyltransferase
VLRQEDVPIEIVVLDNASTDETRKILAEFAGRIRVILSDCNLGFAEGQNRAIGSTASDWVLTLNPDVLLLPGFIRTLVDAGEADPGAGTVCGKLMSIGAGFQPLPTPRIDSTGIYFSPAMRHFDRGWHQPDSPCYQNMEYVFGASAAAALYRRRMIEDVSVDGEFFDPDFFAYREDADVAWRATLLGWRCLYAPAAVSYHVRSVVPGKRSAVPPAINMHSIKNRFLMRIKNVTGGLYRRYWLPMTIRDLLVVGGSVFCEPRSLPAFWWIARCLPRTLHRRRQIMRRRRISDEALEQWFNDQPASVPVAQAALPVPGHKRTPAPLYATEPTA